MGYYTDLVNKRKKKTSSSSNSGEVEYQGFNLSKLEELLKQSGYEPPKPKGPSNLSKALGFLSAGETAPAVYAALEGKDPLQAYFESAKQGLTLQGLSPDKKTYSDVLAKMGVPEGPKLGPISARGVAGWLGDMIIDPTNLFGGALARLGLKTVKGVGKTAFKAGTKLPVVGKGVTKVGKAADEIKEILLGLVDSNREIKRLGAVGREGATGEEFIDDTLKYIKKMRGESINTATRIGGLAREAKRLGVENTNLLKSETGEAMDEISAGFANPISDLYQRWWKEEYGYGLIKSEIDKYLPHIMTPEARELYQKGALKLGIPKPLRAKLGSAKQRHWKGTIEEINKESMKQLGIKIFDDDYFRIAATRGVQHIQAVQTKVYLENVLSKFGIPMSEVDKMPNVFQHISNPAIKFINGVKYVQYQPEGAVKFYKGTFTPAEDVFKQLKLQQKNFPGRGLEQAVAEANKIAETAEKYGIPISRNMRLRTALGTFRAKKTAEKITGRDINYQLFSPEVLSHETGHLLDWVLSSDKFKRLSTTLKNDDKLLKELVKAGKEYGGTGTSKTLEQFAEFFRKYVTEPTTANKEFPNLVQTFENIVRQNPESAGRLEAVQKFMKETGNLFGRNKKWIDKPEVVENLQRGLQRIFPEKSYVGVTRKVPTYMIPEPIAEHLEKTVKSLTNDESLNNFYKIWDKTLSLWKGSVTGFFPSFHIRNLMGGMFNNYIGGVTDPRRYVQAYRVMRGNPDDTLELGGKVYTNFELQNLMFQNGVLGQSGYLDVPQTIEEILHPRKGLAKILDLPKKAMTATENELRGALFIDSLAKGMKPWEAAKKVIQFHFDYMPEGLTAFEKNVMKRIIPFYTWTRNNIPLQLTQMYKQPGKYANVAKTLRMLQGGTAEERSQSETLPDYMKESFPVRLGGDKDNPEYLYGFGLPMEDLNRMNAGDIAGSVAPFIKAPVEAHTGWNFYMDRPLESVKTAPSYFKFAPESIKKMMGYHEYKNDKGKTVMTLDPKKLSYLNAIGGRFSSTANDLFNDKMSKPARALKLLTGIKTKVVDMSEEEEYRTRERIKQLEEFLERMGILAKYSSYYKPKEK